ncbi:MAG TPA: efflux RND transporter periplasmic adaptor subunit [Vicinamibacterales bacterium]
MRTKTLGAASVGGLSAVCAIVFVTGRQPMPAGPQATVRTGPFVETLVERGAVGSARMLLYGSSIAGVQVKIVDLVREGRVVAPGDLLIRFDATTFQQNLAREEALLRQADAELLRAREELRIETLRADGEADQGRQQVGYAQAEVDNQAQGKGRVAVAEAVAAESDARRELDRAHAAYDDMRPMLERGFITRAELDRAAQALKRADEQADLAQLRREAVVGFEGPAAAARSKRELDGARQAVTRGQETSRARLSQQEAAVRVASSRIDEITARAGLLRDQIDRCEVRAGAGGIVVYRELFFGSDKRKPQIGDEVWSNQSILALPDVDRLTVETRIREADLHHVRSGTAVKVTVPAYPDLELKGTVTLIGALAEEDASRAGAKFFPVTIALEGRDARLRTGMTAQVELTVASRPRATLVPVQAVFDAGGRPVVYVVQHGRTAPREVTVEASNDRDAAIAAGVVAGESVLLIDPRLARQEPR